ncbi:hypothetical protein ACRRTK_009601 [Alexandromys fortis]
MHSVGVVLIKQKAGARSLWKSGGKKQQLREESKALLHSELGCKPGQTSGRYMLWMTRPFVVPAQDFPDLRPNISVLMLKCIVSSAICLSIALCIKQIMEKACCFVTFRAYSLRNLFIHTEVPAISDTESQCSRETTEALLIPRGVNPRLCNQLIIKFTELSKKADSTPGKTGGLWLYHTDYPSTDIHHYKAQSSTIKVSIRLNWVINPPQALSLSPRVPSLGMAPEPSQVNSSSSLMITSTINPLMGQKHPLIGLLGRSHLVLNAFQLNLTKACWLCYDIAPPYY